MRFLLTTLSLILASVSFAKSSTALEKVPSQNSQSKNIYMYAPGLGQHDLIARLYYYDMEITGNANGTDQSHKHTGFTTVVEYGYGIYNNLTLGIGQVLYSDAKGTNNNTEYKYSGLGDTSLFTKYLAPIDMMNIFLFAGYKLPLFDKAKENNDSHQNNVSSARNSFSTKIGSDIQVDLFSFGGLFGYTIEQVGSREIVSSGVASTEYIDASNSHTVAVFSQINLQILKLGLALSEDVNYEYKSTNLNILIKNSASTVRDITVYSILPFGRIYEANFHFMKSFPKDNEYSLDHNYYFFSAGLRATF